VYNTCSVSLVRAKVQLVQILNFPFLVQVSKKKTLLKEFFVSKVASYLLCPILFVDVIFAVELSTLFKPESILNLFLVTMILDSN